MEESNYNLNCTNFTEHDMNTFNISRGASAGVCTLIIVTILLVLLYNKKYRSALQRMFLYLTTTTLLLEAFLTMQIERQFRYLWQNEFCAALGFFVQLSGGIVYMFTLGITAFSMYTVYRNLHSDPFQRLRESKRLCTIIEVLFVFGAVGIPLTYHWVPFIHGSYGLAGPYCWINGIDENCSAVGSHDQLAFYIVAEIIGMVSILSAVILAIVYCRIACKYKTIRSQQGRLVCQTLLLMCFLTTHVLTLTVGLVSRYLASISGTEENYPLWFLNAAGIPVSLLVIPLGFLIYLNTINSRTTCCRCHKVQKQVQYNGCLRACCVRREPDMEDCTERLKTNPSSHPIEVRSFTPSHWSVPYTGEFTDISELVVNNE